MNVEDVKRIREIRSTTGLSYAKIGKQFGLNASSVSDIVRGRSYKEAYS